MGIIEVRSLGNRFFTTINELAVVALLTAFALAGINTIWAVYLESFLHDSVKVGLFSAGLSILSFFCYFFFIPVIEKFDKRKLFIFSMFLTALFYIFFAFFSSFILVAIIAILLTIIYTLRVTSFGLIIKESSKKRELVQNEGLLYTLLNLGWVVGPLFAGFIFAQFSFDGVFIISSIFLLLGILVFSLTSFKEKLVSKKVDGNIVDNFLSFFKDKDRVTAYILRAGVSFWWSLIYLFVPLQIIKSGLDNSWIGYFFFGVALPLLILEYSFSKVASKKGFKKFFFIGFFFVAIMALSASFVSSIYILVGLLVIASIGMAMLEPTSEAYFFDVSKSEKQAMRFYGPFNTSLDFGAFLGRIFASLLLIVLEFRFVLIAFAIVMFCLAIFSRFAREIIED